MKVSLATSLANLHTPYLDSWVLHGPLNTHARTMTVWRAMEEGVKSGMVKQLGVSNVYSLDAFKKVLINHVHPILSDNRLTYIHTYILS